jgi:hypothetical protein
VLVGAAAFEMGSDAAKFRASNLVFNSVHDRQAAGSD